MIYVHRRPASIPEELKQALIVAAEALDAIADIAARKKFIDDNRDKWSAIREYLLGMSNGKCWYSEARESVSRYQIDHFRPHGRAKQSPKNYADGYSWLAFELDNFRLAGVLCNVASREYSDETSGKSDWFPLLDPSVRATLLQRDTSHETPLILDPCDPEDPAKLIFNEDGSVGPAPGLSPDQAEHIRFAINCLGLYQTQLNGARRAAWRRCVRAVNKFSRFASKAKGARTPEEQQTMRELFSELVTMSMSTSEFSAVARSCLAANGLTRVVQTDELLPLAEVD